MEASPDVNVFLFTDIEGSTSKWETEHDRMAQAVALHDAILRGAIEGRRGRVIKNTGDGVYAMFADAEDAVQAVVSFQLALADPAATGGMAIRVRCGLHAGPAVERDGDFFGTHDQPHRADHGRGPRRPGAAVRGGGRPHPRPTAGGAVAARARRRAAEGPRRAGAGLAARSPGAARTNSRRCARWRRCPTTCRCSSPRSSAGSASSPRRRSSWGRRACSRCWAWAGSARRGCRCRSAPTSSTSIPDGVWFLDLAPITDPSLVPSEAAQVLGVREEPGKPLLQTLMRAPQVAQAARHRRQLRAPDGARAPTSPTRCCAPCATCASSPPAARRCGCRASRPTRCFRCRCPAATRRSRSCRGRTRCSSSSSVRRRRSPRSR